jgi:SAM-dependent methyltransferase
MSIYYHSESVHNLNTPRQVAPLICNMLSPKSVLDVGCGLGTWLTAFSELGIQDYVGVDGDHVDKSRLTIDQSHFKVQNLTRSWNLGRKYDLVICLEVAEHLPDSASDLLVEALTQHGDVIIFSAAIPGQGGQNHINEQWTSYWQNKFSKLGFYFHDALRPLIWKNKSIEWWYKQNMFLVSREPSQKEILDMIHPDLFEEKVKLIDDTYSGRIGVQLSAGLMGKAVKKWMKLD